MTPQDVSAAARALIGTPWQHQARVPGRGVDCVGLLLCVAWALKLPIPNVSNYGTEPDGTMHALLAAHLDQALGPAPGCVPFFAIGGKPRHVGIYTEGRTLIHAASNFGRVVEHGFTGVWPGMVVEWFAFPGVNYPPGVVRGAVRVVAAGVADE